MEIVAYCGVLTNVIGCSDFLSCLITRRVTGSVNKVTLCVFGRVKITFMVERQLNVGPELRYQ